MNNRDNLSFLSTEWYTKNGYKPTMELRWLESDEYDQNNDCFFKVLQQKWISENGEEAWKNIETFT